MNTRINKINRPLLTDILPRQRLFLLLDQALGRPVVWLNAPGGSGKSSLVASYLDSRRLPCLWYQVDKGDRDVATLFYYLETALNSSGFSQGPVNLPRLPDRYPTIETFARRFFERLFAALPAPCVLVFDDCHEVPDDSPFHRALREGLYEIPAGIHVIVVSRNAPPPLLAHLRSQSRLRSIGWADIRLTADETAMVAQQRSPVTLSREETLLLHERVQGWVAGLVLILEGGSSGHSPVMSGMRPVKEVFDYFAGELFVGMDEDTRAFLLKTAFFSEVTPTPSQQLTHHPDAARLLSRLHEKNCFIERRNIGESTYRYHPLFREFLLEQADRLFTPDEINAIRLAAAIILEESDFREEALELFRDAESWTDVARLIIALAPSCLAQGRSTTVVQWLNCLPGDQVRAHPYLSYWQGACRLPTDPISAFADFKHAYQLFRDQDDRIGQCLAWAAGADATLYSGSIYQEWLPEMEAYLHRHGDFPSPTMEARVIASMFNALSFQHPDHPRIRELERRAYASFCQPDRLDPQVRLETGVYLAVFNLWSGEIDKARFIADRLDLLSRSAALSDLTIFAIKTTQALVDFFTASFESCRTRVFQALQLAEEAGIRALYLHVMGHGLAAALSNGDRDTVEILLDRMKDTIEGAGELDQAYYYFALSWRARREGDLERACHNLAMTGPLLANVDNLPCHAIAHIAQAELFCRRGNEAAAREQLRLARRFSDRLRSLVLEFMCLLLEADIDLERGREEKGVTSLRKALELGRNQGIVNMYWWQPDIMARLCLRALREEIEPEYVGSLIRCRGLMPRTPPIDMEQWPWPVRVYTLGHFEVQINGVPLRPGGKSPKKPLEMLQALISLGGGEMREGQVADLLWPEAEGDTARKSAKSTLHRLRELLGNERALRYRDGRLILDRRQVWSDVRAFEELLARAQACGNAGNHDEAGRLREKALALYQGHFLDCALDRPCTGVPRGRLQAKFRNAVVSQGNLWRDRGEPGRAMACFQRGVDLDHLAEELYRNLMECYLAAGLRGELLSTFQRCRDALALHGLSPAPETVALYREALR